MQNSISNSHITIHHKQFDMVGTKTLRKTQRDIMAKIKPYCTLTNIDVSIESDMSATLVSYVWAGTSFNKKIITTIFNHLQDGWDEHLTASECEQLKSWAS